MVSPIPVKSIFQAASPDILSALAIASVDILHARNAAPPSAHRFQLLEVVDREVQRDERCPAAGGLGLPEDAMNAISSVVVSAIEPALQDLAAQIGQALSDLNAKIDSVVSRLPEEKRDDAEDALRKEIENDLQSTRQPSPLEAEQPQQKAANVRPRLTPINVFSLLNRKN